MLNSLYLFLLCGVVGRVAFAIPVGGGDEAKPVWRGEFGRTPEDVEKAGGFVSRGFQRLQKNDYTRFNPQNTYRSMSLYSHATGDTADYTQYVSTSEDPTVARGFTNMGQKGDKKFMYKIYAGEKAIDMNKSLPPGKNLLEGEREFAVPGRISYDRVEGWYDLTSVNSADKSDLSKLEFHKNPVFQAKYRSEKLGVGHPELAAIETSPQAGLSTSFLNHVTQGRSDSVANIYEGFVTKINGPGDWNSKFCKRGLDCHQKGQFKSKNPKKGKLTKWDW
ncbi:hypothetical protein AA313_de0204450 [Arthrobotrys entomopaga]|nr:hypothetical protein AA313_de0204450 [Arthrobotrys entomopaga]